MTRPRQVLTGAAALLALTAALVGVPWALTRYIGWPLPHALPTTGQLKSGLTTRGIPDADLIKALALVVWAGWASIALTTLAEAADVLRGRERRLPLPAPAHQLVHLLVSAIVVAVLGALPRPAPAGHPPLAASLAVSQEHTAATPPLIPLALRPPTLRLGGASLAAVVSPGLRRYTVQRRDTLWGIAESQLGDGTRWREIFALNESRHQPGGQALTDANLIRPGWTLLLPAREPTDVHPSSQPPRREATAHPSAPVKTAPVPHRRTTPPRPTAPAAPAPRRDPESSLPSPSAPPSSRPVAEHPTPTDKRGASVALGTESEVGVGLAAAVLAALAVARLRRRRSYRPAAPAPARYRTAPPPPVALRDLLHRPDPESEPSPPTPSAAPPTAEPAAQIRVAAAPGSQTVEVGARDGQPVRLPPTGWGGLTLTGPGSPPVARAWLAALLTQAGPLGVHLYGTADLLQDLVPGMRTSPAVRVVADEAALLQRIEREILARGRTLAAAEAPDAASYRRDNPEDPLPLVLAVTETFEPDGRWWAALASARTLDIDALLISTTTPRGRDVGGASVDVAADGQVIEVAGQLEAGKLEGVRLFRLSREDAASLLVPVAADHTARSARTPTAQDLTAPASPVPLLPSPTAETELTAADTNLPEREREPDTAEPLLRASGPPAAPIRVQLLGPLRIWAHGEEVTSGLRSGARELLAWYLLRPDGATADEAIAAIWSDAPPERGPQRFWNALGNLRSRLRAADNAPNLEILTKAGGRYRPETGALTVDVWTFQHALIAAAQAPTSGAARESLAVAAHTYCGDLLAGEDFLWAEPVREELHRRALDVLLRLAELQTSAGKQPAALQTLEHAITIDPYAEEAYRRILTLQSDLQRPDALRRTWALLRNRLAEIDVDPEPETASLYRRLVGQRSSAELPGPLRPIQHAQS